MAWDEAAQRASFTVTNIAPQSPAMNRNIWRCFEVSIRQWAAASNSTYVVVGAISSKRFAFLGGSIVKHFISLATFFGRAEESACDS